MFTRIALSVAASALLAGVALQAHAAPGVTTFTDAINDIDPSISTGSGTLDLVKMEVSNTASDVVFQLTVNGNIGSTDWGKFMIGIANNKGNGTSSSDGWGRPITMSANGGMTHWIGSWVDGGGGSQLWANGSSGWSGPASPAGFTLSAGAQSTITFTVSIASLGMSIGDTFSFDAYSSGGGSGDSAVDALANPNYAISSWGEAYNSGASNSFSYTLGAVPAPGAIALIGIAGLMGRRRRA
jgi:hypothetical protein